MGWQWTGSQWEGSGRAVGRQCQCKAVKGSGMLNHDSMTA